MKLKIKRLDKNAKIPKKATQGSAGFDLCSLDKVVLAAGETRAIRTGLAFDIDDGYEVQIRPRSGLTLHTPLRVHLGTIDCDYTDEVRILVENSNRGAEAISIEPGDRIAQAVVNAIPTCFIEEVKDIEETERKGGLGHTGVK
jgi:dUTP pyrophosphatase